MLSGRAAGRRVGPLDVFARARKKWLAGERIEIGALAAELGVSRATVFRWVGSRELLHGQVLSSLFLLTLEQGRREARGRGAAYLAEVMDRLLHALRRSVPLRRFVHQDPVYAVRVLMSKDSAVDARCAAVLRGVVEREVRAGRFAHPMDPKSLAYVALRIGTAFLYRDVITGDEPDVDAAMIAIRILFGAAPARPAAQERAAEGRE